MTISELIEIAGNMDCDTKYIKFYEFAKNYLLNPSVRKQETTEQFFDTVKTFMDNSDNRLVQSALGKMSNETGNAQPDIKQWCGYILSCSELKDLSIDELNYVMGYCVRIAKIKKAGA